VTIRNETSGFSLVEVTLALGIVAFALLAILGLVPVGMKSSGEAIDATRTSLIGQDTQNRVRTTVTAATFSSATDLTPPPWFYDRDGVLVDTAANGFSNVVYRTDAIVHKDWGTNGPPVNVDATVLRPVTVQLRWPLKTSDGSPLGNNGTSFTFLVRKP
jgi:uncharacterized protein (TIGR02598 family)